MKSKSNIIFKLILIPLTAIIITLFLTVPITLSDPIKISIFHTTDIHGQYLPTKATWLDDNPEIGGFEALSHYVLTERAGLERSLLFDAGDLMTGSALCEIEHKGAVGGALIDMMNIIGYDAMVLGNHEFDINISNAEKLAEIANFPVLSSNLFKGETGFNEQGYCLFSLNGLNVGVIGVTYYPLAGLAPDSKLKGYNTVEPTEIVNQISAEIDSKTDLIIVLSHLGIERDKSMAEKLVNVDLIIGGHSHAVLEEPIVINEILISQAGSKTRYLGRLDLEIEDDRIINFNGRLIPTFTENISPIPEVAEIIKNYESIIDEKFGEIICELKNEWDRGTGAETNVGNFITDAVREATQSDFAFINSGSIRKNIGPGPISRKDILEMMPFDNEIIKFDCSGKTLKQIANKIIGPGESILFSGITIKWRNTDAGQDIVELLVNGELVDDDKIYKVASIDYVILYNSERYLGLTIDQYEKPGYKMFDLIIEAAKNQKIIESIIDGRISKAE